MNKKRMEELLEQLRIMPDSLDAERHIELTDRIARDDAKENYELAVTNALLSANGETDGKNAEERKLKTDGYLAGHREVKAAKAALVRAEGELIDAQIGRQHLEDVFTALRTEARLMGAYLEYLAGEPRQNNK